MGGTRLFSPLTIGGLRLKNRIIIAPMGQYSAREGEMTGWHLMHLGSLAISGAGLVTVEGTAVAPEGRVSNGDVGLYSDACEAAMGRTLESIRSWSETPMAIQLGHAGRKASTEAPWEGGRQIAAEEPGGWQTAAPSAIPFRPTEAAPAALDRKDLGRLRAAFAAAARRAARLELDAVQIHAAHGYLLHQFLSPLSNQRTDEYGGSLGNRMRFPLEVFDAVRGAFSPQRPVSARLSATDWVPGGWDLDQTLAFAQELERHGCAALHVSSGGLAATQQIAAGPGYQVPFARAVKAATRLPVVAVGLITEFEQAEMILRMGDADMIAIARAILYNPRWPWHAAAYFGETVAAPAPYLRCSPRHAHRLFGEGRGNGAAAARVATGVRAGSHGRTDRWRG